MQITTLVQDVQRLAKTHNKIEDFKVRD